MAKNKLTGKKIGVFFGTFAPLHIAHQQEIYKAVMQNDGLVLIASGSKGDRGDTYFLDDDKKMSLNLNRRFRYLQLAYEDEPNIYEVKLDESDLPPMPDGWDEWTERLVQLTMNSVQNPDDVEFTVYTGDSDYVKDLEDRLPDGWNVVLSNRDDNAIPISATAIRENPMKYFNYINRVFRRAFTRKVLVAGSASTGKSTLVRRLARSINAPFSVEYSRDYQTENKLDDDMLSTVTHYTRLIQGQFDYNKAEIKSPSNQGIVFFDTDAIVTRVYAKLYLSDEDFQKLEPFFQETIKREELDVILVIPPVTEYKDDGFRNMEWEESRYEFHNELMKQLEEFGLLHKVVLLDDTDPNDEHNGYYLRYIHAINAIEEKTGYYIPRLD